MTLTHPLTAPRSTVKSYDVAGVLGRFQAPHEGQLDVIETALGVGEIVKIGMGSANLARDTRNPWTYEERQEVLQKCVEQRFGEDASRVSYAPVDDNPYDKAAWIADVNNLFRRATRTLRPRIALVGNIRDQTSEYLTWFQGFDYVPVKDSGLNATAIRRAFFSGHVNFDAKDWNDSFDWSSLPGPTLEFLRKFRDDPAYAYLMKQQAAEIAYRERWGKGPFQTVDPVIVQGDHVLMIERGGLEGTGSIGLPGGFLNAGERLLNGAAREAVEETGLFIPEQHRVAFEAYLASCKAADRNKIAHPPMPDFMTQAVKTLMGYAKGQGERFDDPYRSRRGHLITEAFLFVLPDGHGFPHVVGSDDAKRAFWMPTSEVRPSETFEDHAFIVDRMLSLYL